MVRAVSLSIRAERDLRKAPPQIQRKLLEWVLAVQLVGLGAVRKISGYHDEPLQGDRTGQRSIRLNKAWVASVLRAREWRAEVRRSD